MPRSRSVRHSPGDPGVPSQRTTIWIWSAWADFLNAWLRVGGAGRIACRYRDQSGERRGGSDFKGPGFLTDRFGDRFATGIVLCTGRDTVRIDLGCSIAFKGGTGLSKAHRLMQRFSDAASNAVARDAYEAVVLRNLVRPGAPRSSSAERCARSNDLRSLLQGISG